MAIPLFLVDAFADKPFSGNPAAVCLLPHPVTESWMQGLAMEMNQAETAFLLKLEKGWSLRWFTPTCEVDLCGHATLAAAATLLRKGLADPSTPIEFQTRSGLLTARAISSGALELNFPAERSEPVASPPGMIEALGVKSEPIAIHRNRMDYLIQIASSEELLGLQPDLRRLATIPTRGFIVTAVSQDETCDFVSRFFAPGAGVDEDPVTGSAHCALLPFWRDRLLKDTLRGYQASRRGGYVECELQGNRVLLRGRAIVTIEGACTAESGYQWESA